MDEGEEREESGTGEDATVRILVSLLTDDLDDLHRARRTVAYDRLVLVAHPAAREAAKRVVELERGDDVVRVVEVGGRDARDDLAAMREVLAGHRAAGDEVTLNAAGGTPATVTAAILLAFETGVRTLFVQEGRTERLPVLEGVRVEDRVSTEGRTLLAALHPEQPRSLDDVAAQLGWSRPAVERTCRGLERKGLVALRIVEGRAAVEPTGVGRWLRAHGAGGADPASS